MKIIINVIISVFFCTIAVVKVVSQDVEQPFHYESSVFIIHFTENKQLFSGRSNDEYDPTQGFSLIYDIVIRYVYRMTPLNEGELHFDVSDFAIWHEMVFINNVRGQRLLLGDHVLTDCSGWVQMSNEDYEKLRNFIVKIKKQAEYPLTENKDKLVADWVSELSLDSEILDYDDHFRSMEKYPGDYSAAKVSSANDKSVTHEINPESIRNLKSAVGSQEKRVASSSAKSIDAQAESSEAVHAQSSAVLATVDMPIQDTSIKITNRQSSETNENLWSVDDASHSFNYWLLLIGLGMAFVWYYWRRK